jgi:Lar family restriction alleviation protein
MGHMVIFSLVQYSENRMKLLPCPFCASADLEVHHKPDPYPPSYPNGVFRVECGGCGTQGPFCEERENVAKAWNKRG